MSLWRSILQSKYPIMLAPMAGVSTPKLVTAVSNNGGIGSHGVAMLSPDKILTDIKEIKKNIKNEAPYCINFFVLPKPPTNNDNLNIQPIQSVLAKYYNELNVTQPTTYDKYGEYFEEQFDIILSESPPICSFTFGALSKEKIRLLKKKDIIVMGTATSTKEGEYLNDIGCDIIVAQGSEAGGHRGTFLNDCHDSMIGTMTLVPSIIDKIDNKIPVIAAGGIMDGRGLTATQMLGAIGSAMGTLFLNTNECEIPECYKQILRGKDGYDTNVCLTDKVSGRLARGLKNRFVNEMNNLSDDINVPKYHVMNKLTTLMRNEAKKQNNTDLMSLWCGQGVSMLKYYPYNITVKDLMGNVMEQSYELIK